VDEISGYVVSPAREGDVALRRGCGNDLPRSCLLPRMFDY
jgi:hypothetical protein